MGVVGREDMVEFFDVHFLLKERKYRRSLDLQVLHHPLSWLFLTRR